MEVQILDKRYKIIRPSLQQLMHLDPESELALIINMETILEHLIYRMFVLHKMDRICIGKDRAGKPLYRLLRQSSLAEQVKAALDLEFFTEIEADYIRLVRRLRNQYVHDVLYEVQIEEIEEFIELSKKMHFFLENEQIQKYLNRYYQHQNERECKRKLLYYILFDGCLYFNNRLIHYKGNYEFGFSGRDLEEIVE